MSLFDGKPLEAQFKRNRRKNLPVILSASCMTDMPKYYPDELIEAVRARMDNGAKIHTLMLITKHPASLLVEKLRSFLLEMRQSGVQLYLQCTITGLGGLVIGKCANDDNLVLEPNAPSMDEAIEVLPEVIELLEKPERVKLRIDPIVRVKDAKGQVFSNLKLVAIIIERVRKFGISDISFSFLERNTYYKVDKRFRELGVQIIPPDEQEREKAASWFKELEKSYGVRISACCVQGFPESKCIDGRRLQELHDKGEMVDLSQPRKRKMCGCTHSIDIGGWPVKKCYTGCQYCYANSSYE